MVDQKILDAFCALARAKQSAAADGEEMQDAINAAYSALENYISRDIDTTLRHQKQRIVTIEKVLARS